MKKILLSIAILFATTIGLNAQNCNLKGVVKYEHNDYLGYKIDEGAEIYVISTKNAGVNVDIYIWNRYEKLAKKYVYYLEYKQDEDLRYYGEETIRKMTDFSIANEKQLEDLDKICLKQLCYLKDNAEYLELVDSSGKYALQLPYGEYYVLVKSKNRVRPLVTELTGRVLVERVKIDKPSKILSFDFCY